MFGHPAAAYFKPVSSFLNSAGLKLNVMVGNARMSRSVKPTRAYKRCVLPALQQA